MLPKVRNINQKDPRDHYGFTLIELLIVVTVMGLLAGVLISVVNSRKLLGDSRNARRKVEIKTIADAVSEYAIDKSEFPATITEVSTEICNENSADCTGYIDLSVLSVDDAYLTSIPNDPINNDPDGTGYMIELTANGRLIVKAALAENGETIETTR